MIFTHIHQGCFPGNEGSRYSWRIWVKQIGTKQQQHTSALDVFRCNISGAIHWKTHVATDYFSCHEYWMMRASVLPNSMQKCICGNIGSKHGDVIKWKHFSHYWRFVQRGTHWSPVNSPHKGQWPGALMFFLICAWINGWVNNHEAGDLRRHHAHYDIIVMKKQKTFLVWEWNIPGGICHDDYCWCPGSLCHQGISSLLLAM